jgi:hypothetical protein
MKSNGIKNIRNRGQGIIRESKAIFLRILPLYLGF